MIDPVALTQRLIQFDTVNPPGRELACAEHLAGLLEKAGFTNRFVPLGDGRASLVARCGQARGAKPLVFTGHIDVVPLGARPWKCEPFAGEVRDGRVHGRGASDMKSGVAAFVSAAIATAARVRDRMEIALIITAGEETGCDGAESIVAANLQGEAGALVVCEPTGNVAFVGHKGALWLKAVLQGVTAHGSMPEKGDNAVYKAARAVNRLSCFHFGAARHPHLGAPTLNVGSLHGGLNINSVPDRAEIQIDVRTIPGVDHAQLRERIRAHMEEETQIETLIDLPGIWTAPELPWIGRVGEIVARHTGTPAAVKTATYFSDASVFVPAMGGCPTLVLGPGEPAQAHQTDEWCGVDAIRKAARIYEEMIEDWARHAAAQASGAAASSAA